MRDNSDNTWNRLGKDNPYYGVWSQDRFKNKTLNTELKDEFFLSGERHVDYVMKSVSDLFNVSDVREMTLLDFGCGVGRLLIPFSRHFKKVIGVDISDSMISEANKNLIDFDISNVDLFVSNNDDISKIDKNVDFIHSIIVLQHIPVRRGYKLLDQLFDMVNPGGIVAIDINLACRDNWLRKFIFFLRQNFVPFQYIVNVILGKVWNHPFMQMNTYSLGEISLMLMDKKYDAIHMVPFYQGGNRQHPGVFLLARKGSDPECSGDFSTLNS